MSNTDMINGLMSGFSPIDNFTEYLLYLKKMQTKVHPLLHRARVRGSALEKYKSTDLPIPLADGDGNGRV